MHDRSRHSCPGQPRHLTSANRSRRGPDATGYRPLSTAYASAAVPTVRKSAIVRFCFPLSIAASRFGIEIAAMTPMTTSVMRSSIREYPRESFRRMGSALEPSRYGEPGTNQSMDRCLFRTRAARTRRHRRLPARPSAASSLEAPRRLLRDAGAHRRGPLRAPAAPAV